MKAKPLIVLEPPITRPRGKLIDLPRTPSSGSVSICLETFGLFILRKYPTGIFVQIPESHFPASNKSTLFEETEDNLFASIHPAEPAPIITCVNDSCISYHFVEIYKSLCNLLCQKFKFKFLELYKVKKLVKTYLIRGFLNL